MKLIFFQDFLHVPGDVPAHTHSTYELVLYATGELLYGADDRQWSLRAGTVTLTAPHQPHWEKHPGKTHVLYLGFTCSDPSLLPPLGVSSSAPDTLPLIRAIIREARTQPLQHEAMTSALLTQLMISLRRHAQVQPAVRRDLRYAVDYLRENYAQSINLAALAASIGYGYDYFQHRFHAEMGCSPKRFLTTQRLEAAKRLITQGAPMTAVAYDCGFSSSAHFSKVFSQRFGLSPSAWKKSGCPADMP